MNLFQRVHARRRSTRILAVVGAASLILAACGTSSGTSGSSISTSSGSSTSTSGSSASSTSASGSPSTSGGGGGQSSSMIAAAKASVAKAEQAPTQISETTPLSKTPPRGKLIAFIGGATPPDDEANAGIEGAAKLLGWNTKRLTFDAANISTFNTALLQALTLHADYVVDSGITMDQISKSTLAQYKAANVPILAYNVTPIVQSAPYVSLVGGRNAFLGGGSVLADYFVADSNGAGKALNVNITAYPILTAYADSFDQQVKATCPSCSTVRKSVTFSDLVNGKIATNVISALRADRSIKYVVFDASSEISGLDSALTAAGITDVKLLGFGIDPTTVKSIKSGAAKAFVAYNFRYNGWAAVDSAARLSVGDPGVNPKSVSPSWLITSGNVGAVPSNALFQGPSDALKQFAALWHVPAS